MDAGVKAVGLESAALAASVLAELSEAQPYVEEDQDDNV
jgi:hypothetical protein